LYVPVISAPSSTHFGLIVLWRYSVPAVTKFAAPDYSGIRDSRTAAGCARCDARRDGWRYEARTAISDGCGEVRKLRRASHQIALGASRRFEARHMSVDLGRLSAPAIKAGDILQET
jgi:hypothetical protein